MRPLFLICLLTLALFAALDLSYRFGYPPCSLALRVDACLEAPHPTCSQVNELWRLAPDTPVTACVAAWMGLAAGAALSALALVILAIRRRLAERGAIPRIRVGGPGS
jgi:hypothetical protein